MNITVQREPSIGGATLGQLFVDQRFVCHTLEDEVRELPGVPVADWKIKGATAIPSGTYAITLELSNRFGPDTLTINNVPGFSAIRMHAGNTSADTEGCLLLGMATTDHTIVGGTSRPAVQIVKDLVREALALGEAVTITITNAVEVA